MIGERSIVRSRLIVGSTWNLLATIFNQGSTLAVNIVVARLLGKKTFGEYAIVVSTLLTIIGLVQLSMGITVTKYVAEFRVTDKLRTGRILGLSATLVGSLSFLGMILLLFSAPLIAERALNSPQLTSILMIGAIFLFFSALNGYQIGVLGGLEEYRSLAIAGIIGGVALLLTASLGAWGFGLSGAVTGLSTGAIMRYIFHHRYLQTALKKHNIFVNYDGFSSEKGIVYKFALPSALSTIFSTPIIWYTTTILVRQPGGYEQIAIYYAAMNIRTLVQFLPNVINNVSLSLLNNEKGNGDERRYKHMFRSNVLTIFVVTVIAVIFIGLTSTTILQFFGKDFTSGKFVLLVLLVSTLPESLSTGFFQYINSNGKMWLSLLGINVPRESLFLLMGYILVPFYGALGLAYAYLIACVYGLLSHSVIVAWIYKQNLNESNMAVMPHIIIND